MFRATLVSDRQAFINFIKNKPEVISASWNAPVTFRDSIPNDELFDAQWSLERIEAPKVWDVSTGGLTTSDREIVVAVMDKGFEIIHPDLVANAWKNPGEIPNDGIDNDGNGFVDDVFGWNFRANSPIYSPEKHGTSVSGIIGANGNNGIGTAGINWNVKMMYLAVEYVDEVIAAFDYVLYMRELYNATNGEKGAFIVVTNGSFGIDQAMCSTQAIWGSRYDELGLAGVLSVAATANGDWDVDEVGDMPTSCTSPFLITVTNTGQDDKRASGAAFGQESIDLGAPGQGTATTSNNSNYREDFSGTSAACPHVAGSVALLYSLPCTLLDSLAVSAPAECALLVRDAILENTDAVPSLANETVSGGRLNVYEGMKYLHAYCISREPEKEAGNFKELYVGQKGLISVTPNPTSDRIFIDYGNVDFKEVKIRVFNMLGQEMILNQVATPEPFKPQSIEIDVKDWSTGVYVVNMFDLTKKISVSFLKQ
ncbi:MAG: S8 family peptidase [Saprospiraceae bacterium]|nr:S8 family peptidase [Saprospiraceae bacterium]MCF8250174.1 S8 family peptidase [Saprospiraceae bacterium]MCF8279437.1 S8 family peptidase [Bacteroidales bacterium]MCF8311228.1 S8 family peptidase [Saprospiraceae bacterium]MCF8440392.1 S8 family peptidase [Saprospiraceae bacterium]